MPFSKTFSLWEHEAQKKPMESVSCQSEKSTESEKRAVAREISRFVLLNLQGYESLAQAIGQITPYEAKKLLLDKVYSDIFEWPIDCYADDWDYKIAIVMGTDYDPRTQVKRYWERILDGSIQCFPKNFFDGPNGAAKTAILLDEAMRRFMPFPEELKNAGKEDRLTYCYLTFADRGASWEFLEKAKIADICYDYYMSPLDFFHFSLAPENRLPDVYDKLLDDMEKAETT